ncbi:LCP family protein [Actinoplanes sp. NPDC026619]|uniref:LCP family protein n=1 Tax=Actinoplanes sp. NPDC026619 TaxID=3155798 RepID=UPI003410F699
MKRKVRRRRSPRWARLCLVFGAVLTVVGGGSVVALQATVDAATKAVSQQSLIGSAKTTEEVKHASITGAKNILLVGIDARKDALPTAGTRSDSIILLHIPSDHDSGYMISLPRDSYVPIPAYDNGKQSFAGGKNKINSAFFFGSRGLTGEAALSHGFELLSLTIKELTGITPDAGAIIDFQGFKNVVNVLGKVCMYVDEDTTSIHIGKDNKTGKTAAPYVINPDGTLKSKIKGVTANFYAKGNHCFTPTEALDFVRQRDLLANNDFDYGRQRHQQQFFKAIINQAVKDGLNSPTKLPGLITAIGKTMTVDTGGISLEDWVFAMKGINPSDLITIKTNEGKFNPEKVAGIGDVEILSDDSLDLLKAAKNDTVATFAATHPTWVSAT